MRLRLFSWIYNFGLLLFGVVSLPLVLTKKGKWNQVLVKWNTQLKFSRNYSRPLIWIHAVSLGETKAIASLVDLLHTKYPNAQILISNTTETGQNEAKKSFPYADHIDYLPYDFSWVINPLVKKLKPSLVIFSETDLWYHFAKAAKDVGAHVALVNGKISERSLSRFQWLKSFKDIFFSPYDLFCLQTDSYLKRFQQLGIPNEKLIVTGNLKLDSLTKKEDPFLVEKLYHSLKLKKTDFIIVVGSTHNPEEEILIDCFLQLYKLNPHLKLIIVPRHPERFEEVAELAKKTELPFSLYSEVANQAIEPIIVIMNEMGLLNRCYALSDIAIVGGSFFPKVGGHNILEPCAFGKPVLFGPYMHTQMEFVELIKSYDAGIQVPKESLFASIQELITKSDRLLALGNHGFQLANDAPGATNRTLNAIETRFNLFNT